MLRKLEVGEVFRLGGTARARRRPGEGQRDMAAAASKKIAKVIGTYRERHPRLIGAVKRKGLKQAIIDNMKKAKIPEGLHWAFENGIEHRSLEALVLSHSRDFPEDIRTIARLRLELMRARTASPSMSPTPQLLPPA